MEKTSHSQLELFSSLKDSTSLNAGLSGSFLKNIWNYERIILVFIGFIITGVISFSLGVEKGKRAAVLSERIRQAKIEEPVSAKETAKPKSRKAEPVIINGAVIATQNYTIQVASYKTRPLAQKEAQALKVRGYSPLLLNKSGYVILCVGNFSNKEKAGTLLSELKKYYKDCLIRRL